MNTLEWVFTAPVWLAMAAAPVFCVRRWALETRAQRASEAAAVLVAWCRTNHDLASPEDLAYVMGLAQDAAAREMAIAKAPIWRWTP